MVAMIGLVSLLVSIGIAQASDQAVFQESDNSFQVYQSTVSSEHSLRIQIQNQTLCNTTVKQYTGWLDHGSKHLFFWYFESETPAVSEDEVPLMLWLNGGPGASSMLGLLQELGPCLVNEYGNGTVNNPYGWNKDSALVFVDQPVGVGFSYYDGDSESEIPATSYATATDMDIFLRMFTQQVFPAHRNGPLVLSGESYGGHYIPTLGAQIVRQNLLYPSHPQLNLKSIAVGNPLVNILDTNYGYWETLCTTNPGVETPVFNETICDLMAESLPRSQTVASICLQYPDPDICELADSLEDKYHAFYFENEDGTSSNRNPYDITIDCQSEVFCYVEAARIIDYLNLPSSWSALKVPPQVKNYTISSPNIGIRFFYTMDIQTSMLSSVQYLLQKEIDVLIYSGNLDLVCNTAGSKRWMEAMPWKGQVAFTSAKYSPWVSVAEGNEVVAGEFKEVKVKMGKGEKKTKFALVTINGSGHMVPRDQPEVALDMITRWISDVPFA